MLKTKSNAIYLVNVTNTSTNIDDVQIQYINGEKISTITSIYSVDKLTPLKSYQIPQYLLLINDCGNTDGLKLIAFFQASGQSSNFTLSKSDPTSDSPGTYGDVWYTY